MSAALAGRFLTTGPPGKSSRTLDFVQCCFASIDIITWVFFFFSLVYSVNMVYCTVLLWVFFF